MIDTAGKPWRVVGVGFDHMHMGDQLSTVLEHAGAEIVGVSDTDAQRMGRVCDDLGIPVEVQFTDIDECLDVAEPDVVIVCSTTAEHVTWVEKLAPRGVHILLEKPFARSLAEADRMIVAMNGAERILSVNWPLAWYASHRTTARLIADGAVGDVVEVHYYDGNRGPLLHLHGKKEIDPGETEQQEWWYSRAAGGGSLLDYLGYGVTLATWFRNGELPSAVTAVEHVPEGLEVDVHSVVIASYERGLSTFQTRWGTFTDPWTHQPQPRCGFVVCGTEGTLSSWDYATSVRLQTRHRPEAGDIPVDDLPPHQRNGIAFLLHQLEAGEPVVGPTSWEISRSGQRIVDTAVASLEGSRSVKILGTDQPERLT